MIPIAVDFETHGIEPRPDYPPKPVGVAIWTPQGKAKYWAWGHPEGNNCTLEQARARLRKHWKHDLVFHNASFDLEVARVHLGLPWPAWDRIHDTQILAFLADPNAKHLRLKDLAEAHLAEPPEERDRLREWICEHIPNAKRRPSTWGQYIAQAPGDLVGTYARGDVRRTRGLWRLWHKTYAGAAYDRERRLLPVLARMSEIGVPADRREVARQLRAAEGNLERLEAYIRRRLKAPGLDLDRREALADAIEDAGLLDEWILTPKGQRAIAVEKLRKVCSDTALVGALEARGMVTAALRHHLRPWLEQANRHGRIFCGWNAVLGANERAAGRHFGARTGRLSSTPNLQNIPARQKPLARTYAQAQKIDGIHLPLRGFELPDPRVAIRAPNGFRLYGGDYAQQELRVLAHYARGRLLEAYQRNPRFDLHGLAQKGIRERTGFDLARSTVKNGLVFPRIYGAGIPRISEQTHLEPADARAAKRALDQTIPELLALDYKLRRQGYCVTWGGRHCPVEPRTEDRSFEYKLLNTLIQGSSADITKEAMIRYHEHPDREGDLVLSVHDELVGITDHGRAKPEAELLRKCMESVELDLALPVDVKRGMHWRALK